jgi:hypothetical protein
VNSTFGGDHSREISLETELAGQGVGGRFQTVEAAPPPEWPQSWPVRGWLAACRLVEALLGLGSLVVCLAIVAAIPLLNFMSLGYLLEASGRVARSGRLRDGFIDLAKFARLGSLLLGTWLCLWICRLIASLAADAWLIDPHSASARNWRTAQVLCTVLVVGHLVLAWYAGGRLRHFFWPVLAPLQMLVWLAWGWVLGPLVRAVLRPVWPALAADLAYRRPMTSWFPPAIFLDGWRRGRMFAESRDAVWDYVVGLGLPHYWWLGLRGFLGGLAWLLLPTLMLMVGTSGRGGGSIVIGYLGAIALGYVLLYLPLLQTRFAQENRWGAMFDLASARSLFRRAPLRCWMALTLTLGLALPLFLLKIEPPPRELWWTLSLFFVLFIYPARILTGWAVHRAQRRLQPSAWPWVWLVRLAAVPVIVIYLLILFFTQYTSFLGPASLLEQHAFLLPVPFAGL